MRVLLNKKIAVKHVQLIQDGPKKQISILSQESQTTYFTLLYDICSLSPKQGWNLVNVKILQTRMDLIDKLKSDNKELLLEENEYDCLKDALGENGGLITFTNRESLEFLNYINDLPKKVETKKNK